MEAQLLAGWCAEHLQAAPAAVLFRAGYLSTVVGLRLDDGREVVVKVRPPAPRLHACVQVHHRLFAAGYPCPRPLSDAVAFDQHLATVEAYVPGGEPLPLSGRDPAPFAAALARLVDLAPSIAEVASLAPAPAWTDWWGQRPGLWPWPDDHDVDLNLLDGPAWIDRAGAEARSRLAASSLPAVVGHGDWYTGNLRWHGSELAVVHDWDSVIADAEAAVAGFAAAVYPTRHAGDEATVDETEAFLDEYLGARHRHFDGAEIECAWAAGVWLRAFDAKKQHAEGQPVRSLTEDEADERLRRASAR